MEDDAVVIETHKDLNNELDKSFKNDEVSIDKVDYPVRSIWAVRPGVWWLTWWTGLAWFAFLWIVAGMGGTFVMTGFRDTFGWGPVPATGESESSSVQAAESALGWTLSAGSLVGALPAGVLCDWIGRKWALVAYLVIGNIASIMMLATSSMGVLIAGRALSGVATGAYIVITNIYMSEMLPAQSRGIFMVMMVIPGGIGMIVVSAANIGLAYWDEGWRISYGGSIIATIPLIIAMPFLFESPRQLVAKNKIEQARKCLEYVRYPEQVDKELKEIVDGLAADRAADNGSWFGVFNGPYRQGYRTLTTCVMNAFMMAGGIDAVNYYAPTMLSDFFSSTVSLIGSNIIYIMETVAQIFGIFLIDKYGRVELFLWGLGGVVVSAYTVMFLTIPYTPMPNAPFEVNSGVGVAIVVFEGIFGFSYMLSYGTVVYVYNAEAHNTIYRGKAMSLGIVANTLLGVVVDSTTSMLIQPTALNLWGTFLLFGSINLGCFVWVWTCVPETKGIPLEEMDYLFEWHRPSWRRKKYPGKDAMPQHKALGDGLEEQLEGAKI